MGSSVILPSPGQPKEGPDPNFISASQPNVVSFGFKGIDPPSPLYLQRDDVLVLEVQGNVPVTISINGRLLLAPAPRGGQPQPPETAGQAVVPLDVAAVIQPFQTAFRYTSVVGATQQIIVPMWEGYLLSVSVTDGGSSQRGVTFVRAFIARAPTTPLAPFPVYPLFSDYTTQNHVIGWPGGRTVYSTEGPGQLAISTVGNPAAGADWTLTVPLNFRDRIQSFNAQLVTSATVANRIVRVQNISGLGGIIWQSAAQQAIPASTTAQVSGSSTNVPSITDPTTVNLALPSPDFLRSGDKLAVSTVGLQAGDQWSNITVELEQWVDSGNV